MVSRTTALNAFEQLIFEGYLEGRVGSGTKVSACIPGDVRHLTSSTEPARLPKSRRKPRVARRAPLYSFDKTLPAMPIRPCVRGFPTSKVYPLSSGHGSQQNIGDEQVVSSHCMATRWAFSR